MINVDKMKPGHRIKVWLYNGPITINYVNSRLSEILSEDDQ